MFVAWLREGVVKVWSRDLSIYPFQDGWPELRRRGPGAQTAILLFELHAGGLVRRVNRETLGMAQHLLSIAELLHTVGGVHLPADTVRTAAQTELLLESHYEDLEILQYSGVLEPTGSFSAKG